MRVSNRLAVSLVFGAVVGIVGTVVGSVAVWNFANSERARVERLLVAEVDAGRRYVQDYFTDIGHNLDLLSGTDLTSDATVEFSAAFDSLGSDASVELQRQYIDDNPHPPGRRQMLVRAVDGGEYGGVHQHHHNFFRKLADVRSYYDLFLVSEAGNVVYSVSKENDFATNLRSGPYKDTQLGEVFARIREAPKPGGIEYRDFERYGPSDNVPSSFIGVPLFQDGKFVGTCIVQVLAERLDELMQLDVVEGESNEVYLVGPDLLMRSRSRFDQESTVLRTRVDTTSARAALDELSGIAVTDDYRGVSVYSAYAPIDWQGVRWAVIAEMDTAEVDAAVLELAVRLLLAAVVCVFCAAGLGLLLGARGG